jgi:hypothetical protein
LIFGHERADGDAAGFNHVRVGLDADGLGHPANPHGDVDGARVANIEDDAALFESREALQGRRQRVRTNGQAGEDVAAVRASNDEPGHPGARLGHLHFHAGQRAACFVGHGPGQLGHRRLRHGWDRKCENQGQCAEDATMSCH